MRLGAHLSVAKGLPALLANADELGATAIQIFARNPRGRGETKVTDGEAAAFRKGLRARNAALYIHAPYYVQVGAADARNRRISAEVAAADLVKGDRLGAAGVIVHFGGTVDEENPDASTKHTVGTIKAALKQAGPTKCRLLLEVSAGRKRVGATFEQIRDILDGVDEPSRLGVCLDTCHLFTAGFDIRGAGATKTLDRFAKTVGLRKLKAIHLNDTQSDLGQGLDRHFHIGQGRIGEAAFRNLLRDPRLKNMDFLLETPKEGWGEPKRLPKGKGAPPLDADAKNLSTLRRLAGTAAR
ncbi:MAG: deoxyribonuclease IV [bacterium]|nr:deoxyribonuclease IV [bacterium]MDZ4248187.1 deoxyribonuclease IV [Patescibacteria group bacterium]